MSSKIRHLPALDGLRGLALVGVLLFHAGGALTGGYLGVDLFFVLSGYLITSLLLAEHAASGRIALGQFWVRRARRLMPALLAVLVAVAVYARLFAKPSELEGLRGDALATLGYVANWRTIFSHKSYWDLFARPSPLEHTWSLAIEEQFYVVWPLAITLVLARTKKRGVLLFSLGLAALSMLAMTLKFDPSNTSRAYLGTDTRATGILAGAALAAIVSPQTSFTDRAVRALDVLGVASALGLALAWWKLDGGARFLYRGGFWLTELGALSLIACAISGERSLVARALAWRPLRWLGTVSYGVYLWHWPVNVVLSDERVHRHGWTLHGLQLAVTFAISIASFYLLERPIRTRGTPFGRPLLIVPFAMAVVLTIVVGSTQARAAEIDPRHAALMKTEAISLGGDVARFRITLLGDSTANSLGWGLKGVQQPGLTVDLEGKDGCTMLMESACRGAEWPEIVQRLHPNATLVFVGGAFLHGMDSDGWRVACYPAWHQRFEENLGKRLAGLKGLPTRAYAVTLPYPLGRYDTDEYRAQVDCINASVKKSAASAGVPVLDLGEELCPKGRCERESEGVEIRPDGVHYTIDGASKLSRWVLEQIEG